MIQADCGAPMTWVAHAIRFDTFNAALVTIALMAPGFIWFVFLSKGDAFRLSDRLAIQDRGRENQAPSAQGIRS